MRAEAGWDKESSTGGPVLGINDKEDPVVIGVDGIGKNLGLGSVGGLDIGVGASLSRTERVGHCKPCQRMLTKRKGSDSNVMSMKAATMMGTQVNKSTML